MADLVFLNALKDKLKGGNIRSIHLNALPGRYVTRLDIHALNEVKLGLAEEFLKTLFSKTSFEFDINFDSIDLNTITVEEQKRLGVLSKRLNSLCIENEDNFKEHGVKTFSFGYPLLIKRSTKDPKKVIKAPLFIWSLEVIKSTKKVNSWTIIRNKAKNEQGKMVKEDIHSICLNEVLSAFIKAEDGIVLPTINEEFLDDQVIDDKELLAIMAKVIEVLNGGLKEDTYQSLQEKYNEPLHSVPEASHFDSITNNTPWICFGGMFGLFRSQKESIITDIDRLIENFDNFEFDNLQVDPFGCNSNSPVQTDPTQQKILNTLSEVPNKIIQGPPGTGKSQSLTALITNAISNNLKCLVVCEKKTALDVIKKNLERTHSKLGELSAIIEDSTKDREGVVNVVRERLQHLQNPGKVPDVNHEMLQQVVNKTIKAINETHQKLDRKIHLNRSWTALVGYYLHKKRKVDYTPLQNKLSYEQFSFDTEQELLHMMSVLAEAEKKFAKIRRLDHPLGLLDKAIFLESNNLTAIELEISNYMNSLVTETATCKQLINIFVINYREKASEWKNYHPFVQLNTTNARQLLQDDNMRVNAISIDLENSQLLIKELQYDLHELKTNIQAARKKYRDWLIDHYSSYYDNLSTELNKFLTFGDDCFKKYGKDFYSNKAITRTKIKVFKIFSSKYQQLTKAKADIPGSIEKIRSIHEELDYIDHAYLQVEKQTSTKLLLENIGCLRNALNDWYNGIDQSIESFCTEFRFDSLHKIYKQQGQVVESLEQKWHALIDRIKTNKVAAKDFEQKSYLPETIAVIEEAMKELLVVSNDLARSKSSLSFIAAEKAVTMNSYLALENKILQKNYFAEKLKVGDSHLAMGAFISAYEEKAAAVRSHLDDLRSYNDWVRFVQSLDEKDFTIVKTFIEQVAKDWANVFECWYFHWLLAGHEHEVHTLSETDEWLETLRNNKRSLDELQVGTIIRNWTAKQHESVAAYNSTGRNVIGLYNKKGKKGERRNSLRKIIKEDINLFTNFFPVLMVSPSVCSSIIPLKEGLFDLVIFDEASQLRLEDTYPSLIRGRLKIISGDSQQMPPSSYFQGSMAVLSPGDDEDENDEFHAIDNGEPVQAPRYRTESLALAESESLLAYAENKGFQQEHLKVHYRSCHPDLIEFSNHAFYGKRLIPMPAKQPYKSIQVIEVGGLYHESMNRDEAKQVVNILLNHIRPMANGKLPTVGVATLNIYQRNLILEEITKVQQSDPEAEAKINALQPSLFVKNLENIQGDERDIIIISTTFGRTSNGSFSQHFGPIIQKQGYKLLNVIVTRAKYKVFLCTSIPDEYIRSYSGLIKQQGNNGRAAFYAYLAYAKAVHSGDEQTKQIILNELFQHSDGKHFEVGVNEPGSESPFEEEVFRSLAERIDPFRIEQQYKIGGFRVDLVVKSKLTGKAVIAIECDGAKYHSSNEAYSWDLFRQEQLEKFGLKFHRIWSTKWWLSVEKETNALVDVIRQYDTNEFGTQPQLDTFLEHHNIDSVMLKESEKPRVSATSKVTVINDEGNLMRIRFSNQPQRNSKANADGFYTVYTESALAKALMNQPEGETCKLGMLEVYYKIKEIVN